MKSFFLKKSQFISLIILILLAVSIPALQFHIDTNLPHPPKFEDMKYLPSGKFLKGMALSYDELLADLLWIKAIGYFGSHAVTDKNYEWLYHILEITTDLDPRFQYPYEFGGVIFATEIGDIDKSTQLLKKGMLFVPKDHWRYWNFPFLIAFNYMFYKKDYKTAAQYLEMAAKLPGSPEYLPLLIARLYANANSSEVAITFLRQMIKNTESKNSRKQLEKRLKEVMVDRDIRKLENARDLFLTKEGRYPKNLEELVEKGFIAAIPKEPMGGEYWMSSEDHAVYSSMADKLKVHIDVKKKVKVVPFEKK